MSVTEPNEPQYVRVCPVCGYEHQASAARCGCGTLLTGVDLSLKAAKAGPAQAAAVDIGEETLPPGRRCPHPDCGAISPADAERCVYCDRPFEQELVAFLDWPWGEHLEVRDRLVFGREGDIPEPLRRRLGREFDNISRRHAELTFADGQFWITDLGSANGTYVNGDRISPRVRHALKSGNVVRFAANLAATVRLR